MPVALHAQTIAPFADEIAAFAHQDSLLPPPARGIVFTGSSSIRMWQTLQTDFPSRPVLNRGFGGSQLSDVNHYFDKLITPYHPRQVVLYAGDNDINAGVAPEKVMEEFRTFAERLHRELPGTRLLYIAIKPSLARFAQYEKMQMANKQIQQYTKTHRWAQFVDVGPPMLGADGKPRPELFQSDGLHMTPAGYALWTKVVRPYLAR
ncbi:SGNH/GDSL hydrolase family protein [Hymenobacter sp. GOD-10R]|uniref:SGNH/GDSL hydrolase family protein n=1 Tax=Hymenobacter sp. GOD-10R TaxID=3093922 RepID=UPI002D78624D|nr:SGNH/GDSL hydrolase family protein [Hymenobacter sp. GOD-10R]WRQ30902.1 SGNH/GDSL hydrolase family protein [Hymenobacter sp. GOD-10R]